MFRRLSLIGIVFLALPVWAGDDYYAPGGVALEGYDPVAYFTQGRAVPGKSAHVFDYDGVKWHFSSAENLRAFQAAPAQYLPQYGGYCAFGVAARQRKVRSDPTVFDVVDGKLYLNFNERFRRRWSENAARMIRSGDRIWPGL